MLAKIAVRVDASPVASPRQNGELADSASSTGSSASRLGHGHVHVHAEHELAARHVLELLDEPAVAVARRDALILGARERVRPGAGESQAERLDGSRDAAPDGLEVAAELIHT